jgi:hypothetical protein
VQRGSPLRVSGDKRRELTLVAEVRLLVLEQALDDLATDEVFVDDLRDVLDGDVLVPDLLRVHDDADAAFALVEAAGVVGANQFGEPTRRELGLELVAHIDAALGLTRALRMVRRALVDTDEDVALETRHLSRTGYHFAILEA